MKKMVKKMHKDMGFAEAEFPRKKFGKKAAIKKLKKQFFKSRITKQQQLGVRWRVTADSFVAVSINGDSPQPPKSGGFNFHHTGPQPVNLRKYMAEEEKDEKESEASTDKDGNEEVTSEKTTAVKEYEELQKRITGLKAEEAKVLASLKIKREQRRQERSQTKGEESAEEERS